MITGVKLIKSSKVNSFINLLMKTKPNTNNNVKTQHIPVIINNREKWDNNNALRLYHKYFAVFSFETIPAKIFEPWAFGFREGSACSLGGGYLGSSCSR